MKWTKVVDGLPDDASKVLFRVENNTYEGVWLGGCETFHSDSGGFYFPDDVTDWMPIKVNNRE